MYTVFFYTYKYMVLAHPMYTIYIYDRIFDRIPAKNIVYTPLEPFKELGLNFQKAKLHVHPVNHASKLVQTRRALSSTIINSLQETVSSQACSLPEIFLSLGGVLRYPITKWLLFLD
jgi:hypothetical protein